MPVAAVSTIAIDEPDEDTMGVEYRGQDWNNGPDLMAATVSHRRSHTTGHVAGFGRVGTPTVAPRRSGQALSGR